MDYQLNIGANRYTVMRLILSIIPTILVVLGCGGVKSTPQANDVCISGRTYNITTAEPLNGTFVISTKSGKGTATDSLGNFSITVQDGDSLRFEYVGMKKRTIPVHSSDSTRWSVAMDTLNLILIGNEVIKTE